MIGEDTIDAEIEEGRKLAVEIPERRGIGPGTRCGGKEGVLGTKGPGMHQEPRGVGVGDVQQLGPEGSPGSRFLFFEDPDGNGWAVQER